jgi:hypothetical protein
MPPDPDDQFDAADRAIEQAANARARQVTTLLGKTRKYDRVAPDYVIEQLILSLFREHPAALGWLDRQGGQTSMRLAESLKDYLDLAWGSR